MKELKDYNIPFVGLKTGLNRFDYVIKEELFDFFGYEEFNETALNVVLDFDKGPSMFVLNFKFSGSVNINCDVSNEKFDLDTEGELKLIVKFGEEFNDENPEILVLPHGEYEINVAQYIYEMIVLAQPSKRIHPGIEDGTLNSDVTKKLEELQPKGNFEEEETVDPRWDQLKKFINK
ncbi:MAG: DUF177 domain-containing protein [Flavobacteriales bacterium]|nr:DUF177 domain-containing protein [Flavobacteriales bacterium]